MTVKSENHVSSFVKYNRAKSQMTQEELAQRAGVGLRFIRELEQGKATLRLDKVDQVLQLFGYNLFPGPARKQDPWKIVMNHLNRRVRVYLTNKTVLVGFLVDEVREGNEIKGWKFVSDNNDNRYRKTKDPSLLQILNHADIENVENI